MELSFQQSNYILRPKLYPGGGAQWGLTKEERPATAQKPEAQPAKLLPALIDWFSARDA